MADTNDDDFEALTDSASAEPAVPAASKTADSPLVERMRQIHGHPPGTIPPPDPTIISPDSTLGKLGEVLGTYAKSGEITDAAMAAFYQSLREEGGTADLPAPSSVYADTKRPAFPAAVEERLRRFHHNVVDEMLHGPHPQHSVVPEPIEDIELGKISTAAIRNMRLDEPDTTSLASSMATFRQLTPVIVVRDSRIPGLYHLAAGFRRFRAAHELGWPTIKAVIRTISCEAEALLLNAIENVARKDPTTYELAVRCEELIRRCEIGIQDLAKQLGKSISHIYCLLKLLSSLPANALRDWQHSHPAASLARLEAVLRKSLIPPLRGKRPARDTSARRAN